MKVVKHAPLSKRKGYVFKSYKEFECFLLDNGMILFYTQTPQSKKYGQESQVHRMQLDETVRIESEQRTTIKVVSNKMTLAKNVTRFTLRIGRTWTQLQADTELDWVDAIKNFKFKK